MTLQDNSSKLQSKNNKKENKDTEKWHELHKNPTHNMNECRAKQALVSELKGSETDACSDSKMQLNKGTNKGKKIIDI